MAISRKQPIPAPLHDIVAPESGWDAGQRETAVFAGGCFWGVQSVFQRVKGVVQTTVGYSGGDAKTANYRAVCAEDTGHAEALEIVYDPALVSYGMLLRVFFSVVHDPTQLNRQGADVGTSYRSAIFYHSATQKAEIEKAIAEVNASHLYSDPIVTQVVPYTGFYPAESYHYDYYLHNPDTPYCQFVVAPKVAHFKELYHDRLK